jgi:hypothetical protein
MLMKISTTNRKLNIKKQFYNLLKQQSILKVSILLLIIFTCFSSFSKESGSSPSINYTLSKDGLAYIQLTPGKYFIYKDSATLQLDSVVVTESLLKSVKNYTGGINLSSPYTADDYTLILSKINSPGNTIAWLAGEATAADSTGNIYMARQVPSGNGDLFDYPPCNCGPEMNISSMVVEGKTYTDIILTSDSQSDPYSYYWANGVGLIKCTEIVNSVLKTYTLLRHN